MNYLRQISTRQTPQDQPLPGQVPNSAGGHAWEVTDQQRLRRFLILGSEGGSYYARESKLTTENAEAVMRCIAHDGPGTVKEIVEVSTAGRAPKNDPAIFALALCASVGDVETRKVALDALPEVCRIGTHLFHFIGYAKQFRGWGRGLRRAVGEWYERDVNQVAYQAVKYRQRDGYSHRDVLRLAHVLPITAQHDALYAWIVGKTPEGDLPEIVTAYERAQIAETPAQTVGVIGEFPNIPREALNPDHLTDPVVWEALLFNGMPMTALVRNLATMTRVGLLTPTSAATAKVIDQITNSDALRKARVHPIALLAAMRTYEAGVSVRGSNTWDPIPRIVDALDEAFYMSFDNVEPTGKRYLLALDVSGSMDGGMVAGVPGLSPRVASSAMAMVTARTGDPYECVAFTGGGWYGGRGTQKAENLSVLSFSPRQRLDDIMRATQALPFGGTDCALPMLYATERNRDVDVFCVYTDSETWAGSIHPSQALQRYREKSGINAKLVTVGMVSNGFTIADPKDPGQIDLVGFDTSSPNVISEFAVM